MKLQKENISYIIKAFNEMKSKEDLLSLLNFAKVLLYGEKAHPFELKQLLYHCNPKANPFRYVQFVIKKKSGGERVINSPSAGLKSIQKCLNLILQTIYDVSPSANGFVPGKSIVDNAKSHVGSYYVYNIDLKDFFSSIEAGRLWARLQFPPFNLKVETGKKELANIITWLCSLEMEVERLDAKGVWIKTIRNVLPQGSPTSPTLSNIICQKLDYYLSAAAKRFGLRYSRYADDITFSSLHNVYQENSTFLNEVKRIISEQKFTIKESKTRLQKEGYRQEVTGLIVNEKVNVPQRYIKQLRMWLYYWEAYGYNRANSYFLPQYKSDKGHTKKGTPTMLNVIAGKLDYLKMVKGEKNEMYLKLRERFINLRGEPTEYEFKTLEISKKSNVIHKPVETVKFLKYFKYDNQYSFKDLVHLPVGLSNFNYLDLLKQANKQFLEISQSSNDRLNLPKNLLSVTQNLFTILSDKGLDYFTKTGCHPLEDNAIGLEIQKFKQNYRFGNEKSESSILSNLISNIAKKREFVDHGNLTKYSFGDSDTSGLYKVDQITFIPDLQHFQSKANFFTWVPNIKLGLSQIFDAILKHSNVYGDRSFDSLEKKIEISINRKFEGDKIQIELSILDKNSLFTGELANIMNDMRRDLVSIFIGVCDFKVQFETADNRSFECKILPYADEVVSLDNRVGGFNYIFTFYD